MTANRHVRHLIAMAAISLAMLAAGWWAVDRFVPPQDNPFKPLDLTDPPGLATGMKLRALKDDPALCRRLLANAGVAVTPADREIDNPACSLDGALTLDQSLTPYSQTLTMTCPLLAAVHVWERHVVIPAAVAEFGAPPSRIETFGSYSCRKVRGGRTGGWSQHATANAIDISGFSFAERNRVLLVSGHDRNTPEGRFLTAVRDGACGLFAAVLGPEYNALHRDHFHFEMGTWSRCS